MLDLRRHEINYIPPPYHLSVPADLKAQSSEMYGTSPAKLESPCRLRNVVWARFMVCYALRDIKGWSFARIGNELGGRDHSTIMHACDRAKKLYASNPDFRAKLDSLFARFGREVG